MKRTNKIIIVALLLAVLLLGVGYAAIQNVTLYISGTAAADPSQENFKVIFTGTPEVSDATYATAGITNETNATINVKGLTTKGQKVTATYTIQNVSTDLSADLGISTTNSNKEYFKINSELAKTSLKAGETTTVTASVELIKTPISESVSSAVVITIVAAPVQPGEEGTNRPVIVPDEPTVPTLAEVTNANIGDYIDLGNNIVKTEATTDDWRIFYKDENAVYAILSDYLPANQVPAAARLVTSPAEREYSVWSDTNRDTLVNGLTNTAAWSKFANGIEGATVTGSPTKELLENSYTAKNGAYNSPVSGDLYVPRTASSANDTCKGYWLASPYKIGSEGVWQVFNNGNVNDNIYSHPARGIRPVVALPTDIQAKKVDGVWKVNQ